VVDELGHAGVVHQAIDPAPARHRLLGDTATDRVIGNVALLQQRFGTGGFAAAAVSAAALSLRAKLMVTLAPQPASSRAVAAPMPVDAPVTM